MTTALLHTGSTSSSLCSVMMMVVPSSLLILTRHAMNSFAAIGSSWLVGSSSISTSGDRAMTDARFTICFCPPDSSATRLWNIPDNPKNEHISATRRLIYPLSYPRLSNPNASSCHTLSVTSCASTSCCTNPICLADVRSSISSRLLPLNSIFPDDLP